MIVTVVVGACRYGFDVAPPADSGASGTVDSAIDELPGCIRDVVPSTLTTCVLFRDGHVECIGRGTRGELGTGAMQTVTSLTRVIGIDDAVKLVGAAYGFCVIRADRTAWCWGDTQGDRFGALGAADLFTPVMVPGVSNVADIDSGAVHTCAITGAGAVSCWGDNAAGQLGDGTTTPSSSPVAVSLPGPATRVMAGWGASCALLADGRAFCWGANGAGNWPVPTHPGGLDAVVEVDAHALSMYLRRQDGTVWAFGRNDTGQLADGNAARSVPTQIDGLSDVISVAGADDHACAVVSGGEIRCWGANDVAQLGSVGAPASRTPVAVGAIPPVVQVRAGQFHSCAIGIDGNAYCWGENCCYQAGSPRSDVGTAPQQLAVTCP